MRLLRPIVFFAALMCACSSCQFMDAKNALRYNDSIMAINQYLTKQGTMMGNSVQEYAQTGEYSKLKPLRLELMQYFSARMQALERKPSVGVGGEAFKAKELQYLHIEQQMISTGFAAFENLAPDATADDIQAVVDRFANLAKDEDAALAALAEEQKKYAKANHFKLGEKDVTPQ